MSYNKVSNSYLLVVNVLKGQRDDLRSSGVGISSQLDLILDAVNDLSSDEVEAVMRDLGFDLDAEVEKSINSLTEASCRNGGDDLKITTCEQEFELTKPLVKEQPLLGQVRRCVAPMPHLSAVREEPVPTWKPIDVSALGSNGDVWYQSMSEFMFECDQLIDSVIDRNAKVRKAKAIVRYRTAYKSGLIVGCVMEERANNKITKVHVKDGCLTANGNSVRSKAEISSGSVKVKVVKISPQGKGMDSKIGRSFVQRKFDWIDEDAASFSISHEGKQSIIDAVVASSVKEKEGGRRRVSSRKGRQDDKDCG